MKAYPSPWRTDVLIRSTTNSIIYLDYIEIETREETDLIEFVEGQGSLQYPGYAILSIVWKSIPLGAVTLVPYASELNTPTSVNQGYGLAEITYQVKCITYATGVTEALDVQYVLENVII